MSKINIKPELSSPGAAPAGYKRFYFVGDTLRFKNDAGVEFILATTTQEEIEDIVGALLADSSTINAVYNDAGNLLTFDVIQTAIDHVNLQNKGTNTHAQIDAHIASTANPHATTAVQVGADPVGSAAAAQAAAVQRANHTGTQLAATISDFAAAVLAAVLTGFTVGTNAAIAATDTVLQAFGKIQAQINAHYGVGGATHPDATTSVSGYMSGADKTKLNGIATGATANSSDATLLNRANHTGTQLAATISDFASAVRGVVLTGLTLVDSAIIATDSILAAFGKIQGQLNQRVADFNATIALIQADMAVWNELATTADIIVNSNVTLTSVTELQFPVVAGRSYYIEATVKFRTAATTTGITLTMGTPNGAAGDLAMQVNIPIAADGTAAIFGGSVSSLGDVVTSTGVQTAQPTWFCANMKGIFVCTTSGDLVPQFRSEVNGSNVNFGTGSVILVREFA